MRLLLARSARGGAARGCSLDAAPTFFITALLHRRNCYDPRLITRALSARTGIVRPLSARFPAGPKLEHRTEDKARGSSAPRDKEKKLDVMPEQAYDSRHRPLPAALLLERATVKPVRWVGSSREDVSGFPDDVKGRVGQALWKAQTGSKATFVKPLKGFGGASVLEVVDDFDGDTYRAVYTGRFGRVYVLHAFQKKSRQGIATPRAELDLIRARLARAREDYEEWQGKQQSP